MKVWVGKYREELILNVTVLLVTFGGRAIQRGTDTECYCVGSEGLGKGI